MIVVSASLKKSGSGWYFNMTNDLLVRAGHRDVRDLRHAYGLQSVLQDDNCRITPTARRLAPLLVPHLRGETFVVKTHDGPSPGLRLLMRVGAARATYIYRDPRDVVLSALDHGEELRKAGADNVLAGLHSVSDAVRYVQTLLQDWEAWVRCGHTLLVRYEDLVGDPTGELQRLADFLRLPLERPDVEAVAARYRRDGLDDVSRGRLHFNQGVAGRYRTQLSPGDLDLCTRQLGPYLERMGYV